MKDVVGCGDSMVAWHEEAEAISTRGMRILRSMVRKRRRCERRGHVWSIANPWPWSRERVALTHCRRCSMHHSDAGGE